MASFIVGWKLVESWSRILKNKANINCTILTHANLCLRANSQGPSVMFKLVFKVVCRFFKSHKSGWLLRLFDAWKKVGHRGSLRKRKQLNLTSLKSSKITFFIKNDKTRTSYNTRVTDSRNNRLKGCAVSFMSVFFYCTGNLSLWLIQILM